MASQSGNNHESPLVSLPLRESSVISPLTSLRPTVSMRGTFRELVRTEERRLQWTT